jgi:hypothetical protein
MGKFVCAKMKNVFPRSIFRPVYIIFVFDVGGLNGMGYIVMTCGNLSR